MPCKSHFKRGIATYFYTTTINCRRNATTKPTENKVPSSEYATKSSANTEPDDTHHNEYQGYQGHAPVPADDVDGCGCIVM